LFDKRLNDAVAIFVADLCQHHKAGVALDQCGDEAVAGTCDQITFPVPWYSAIFYLRGPLTDRNSIVELPQTAPLQRGMT